MKYYLLLFFYFNSNSLQSQLDDIYNQYFIQHFNTDNGLNTNSVWYSKMGEDGRIYLATDDGIAIFDGLEFERIGIKDGLKSQSLFGIHTVGKYMVSHSFKGQDIIEYNK